MPSRTPMVITDKYSMLRVKNGEICLQKCLSISGKLSITKYLQQIAVDYRSHLTIDNNLKIGNKGILFQK